MRIGHGFDVHRLVAGKKLILGGVEVPYHLGLTGHSDADVVIHAVVDAILGAAGMGDIGQYYPPNDQEYKNIDSRIILRQVVEMLLNHGFKINNVDITIVAEEPKLAPYRDQMRLLLAEDLRIMRELVNVKAKTTEGLGFTGRKEGIAAYAVVSIHPIEEPPKSHLLDI